MCVFRVDCDRAVGTDARASCGRGGTEAGAGEGCVCRTYHWTTYAAPWDVPGSSASAPAASAGPRARPMRSALPRPHRTHSFPAPGPRTAPPPMGRVAITGAPSSMTSSSSIAPTRATGTCHAARACLPCAESSAKKFKHTAARKPRTTAKPARGFPRNEREKKPRLELRVPRPHTSRRAAEGGEEAGDRVRWGISGARTGSGKTAA